MANLNDKDLREYIFLNYGVIESFCDQILFGKVTQEHIDKKISVGTSGVKIEFEKKEKNIESIFYKIELIEDIISYQGKKISFRPSTLDTADEHSFKYVKETFDAYKVIIPVPINVYSDKVSQIVLWVSEPDPEQYVNDGRSFIGTFLFLVESFNATPEFCGMMSGCSALQYVYNLSKNLDESALHQSGGEPFGRWNYIHPLEKIKSMGGEIVSKKRVTSLYKMKYFTNEQSYTLNQQERRVNDLLSYPLYIIEEKAYSDLKYNKGCN